MRLANSLDSLDCVTNSIQQARANSWARARAGDMQGADQVYGSPQLLRINRSNSMRSVYHFAIYCVLFQIKCVGK